MRPVPGIIAILLIVAATASAEEKEKPAYKLELKPDSRLPSGTAALVQGDSNPEGDQFFLENVGVLQPVAITLIAKNEGDQIKLVLAKQRWDEKIRESETGPGKKTVTEKLRTQGEVRMIVKADGDPKPYLLVVWVGDEVKPDMAPVVSKMKEYSGPGAGAGSASAGGGSSSTTTAIVVMLGVIIVLLLIIVLRKRGSK